MEATIPRSFPVITGLPLSFGSRDCSQEAKKASPSIWTMARGKPWMESGGFCMVRALSVHAFWLGAPSVFSDDGFDDGGDAKLLFGRDGLVFLVGGHEDDVVAALTEIFHSPVAVNFGDHDIAVFCFAATLDKRLVSGHDARFDHGVAFHVEQVRSFLISDKVVVERY